MSMHRVIWVNHHCSVIRKPSMKRLKWWHIRCMSCCEENGWAADGTTVWVTLTGILLSKRAADMKGIFVQFPLRKTSRVDKTNTGWKKCQSCGLAVGLEWVQGEFMGIFSVLIAALDRLTYILLKFTKLYTWRLCILFYVKYRFV